MHPSSDKWESIRFESITAIWCHHLRIVFTIDVDDTLTSGPLGQIRVAGSEIEGGRVILTASGGVSAEAAFDDRAVATLPVSACTA